MPPIRFVSPERRWRAAFMVPLAAWFGWRAFVYLGPVAGCLVAAGLLGFAVPIMRTCLIANDEGLTDRATAHDMAHGPLMARDLGGSGAPCPQRRPSLRSPPAPGWYSRP